MNASFKVWRGTLSCQLAGTPLRMQHCRPWMFFQREPKWRITAAIWSNYCSFRFGTSLILTATLEHVVLGKHISRRK